MNHWSKKKMTGSEEMQGLKMVRANQELLKNAMKK